MKTYVYINPTGTYETDPYFFGRFNTSINLQDAKLFYDTDQLKQGQRALEVKVERVPVLNVEGKEIVSFDNIYPTISYGTNAKVFINYAGKYFKLKQAQVLDKPAVENTIEYTQYLHEATVFSKDAEPPAANLLPLLVFSEENRLICIITT